jgi:fucose permease
MTPTPSPPPAATGARARPPQRLPVATLYLSGMLQGLTVVSFPASSAVLKQMHGFTDAEYGAIFLPQVAAAVIGALAGGNLAARTGLEVLLRVALACNALSQLLLAATAALPAAAAFAGVLLGTASLGLAFGLSGAPLNGLPPLLFPRRRDTALVALHTFLGLGLAVGPIIANAFIAAGLWTGFPALLAVLALALAALAARSRFPRPAPQRAEPAFAAAGRAALDPMPLPQRPEARDAARPARSRALWLFLAIAALYAFAEGTFGNWAVLYLQDVKGLPEAVAAAALSSFWAAIVAGRLLASVLVLRVAPARIWLALPLLMAAAFLLMPHADTPARGVGLFALAGLACSAFFPLCIGLAAERFPAQVPWVSSMLIAALTAGVGVGSYAVGLLRELLAMEALYRLSAAWPLLVLALAMCVVRARPDGAGEPASGTDRSH